MRRFLAGDRLHQAPAPELMALRETQSGWLSEGVLEVTSEAAFPVPLVYGAALSVGIEIDTAASKATAFSILLLSQVSFRNQALSLLFTPWLLSKSLPVHV